MSKPNMTMTNRFIEKEKLLKQFDKKTITLKSPHNSEKTFEYTFKGDTGLGPTVVLINGAGGPIEGWMKIWPLFDATMSVFAYNRLGIDKSSVPTEPQHAVTMADDLRNLLLEVDVKPPYLLVGHSLGGFIAHMFAAMYPKETHGVLFLEASTVEDVTMRQKRIKGSPFLEVNCVLETVAQIKAISSFPQIPIRVIAGFHPISRMWLPKDQLFKRFEHQKKLLELSVHSSLTVATKSGHFPQMNEPRLVAAAIYDMMGR